MVANLRLTTSRVTVLYPLARHFNRCLVMVQPRKTGNGPIMIVKLLLGCKASKQTKHDNLLVHDTIHLLWAINLYVYFGCVDALHPSQQFFSHVRMFSWVEPELSRG